MTSLQSTAVDSCPHCGRRLEPLTVPVMGSNHFIGYAECGCPEAQREAAREREREAHEKQEQQRRDFERRLGRAGIPRRFWSVEPCCDYRDALIAGDGLFIAGTSNGTGKTMLAAAIAKDFMQGGHSVRFVTGCDLLTAIRSTYGGEGTEADVIANCSGVGLLVLDDLGKEKPSEWATSLLFQAVNGRYNAARPIIVTSNYSEPELVEHLSVNGDSSTAEAIVSRLIEMTEHLTVDGPDYRIAS